MDFIDTLSWHRPCSSSLPTGQKWEELMGAIRSRAILSVLLFAAFSTSCARQPSPTEKRVAAEVAQEDYVPAGGLKEAKSEVVFEAEGLTPRQRNRLQQLHANSANESERIKQELRKNHMVLMRSLVDPKTKDSEIEVLKDRIVRLERMRTQHFLSSLDNAKRILGRRNMDDERIYRAFLMEPHQTDVMP